MASHSRRSESFANAAGRGAVTEQEFAGRCAGNAHRQPCRREKQLELLAYFIDQLKKLKGPDGSTVFDNSLLAYGSGIRTNHDLRDTPTLVAGHGGGGMNQGQHYVYESAQTPLSNLWLSMLIQVVDVVLNQETTVKQKFLARNCDRRVFSRNIR